MRNLVTTTARNCKNSEGQICQKAAKVTRKQSGRKVRGKLQDLTEEPEFDRSSTEHEQH